MSLPASGSFGFAGLLGAATRDEEEFVTEFRRVPEGWVGLACLALVVALCWAVVWMYRREGRLGSTTRMRTGLAVIRCAVILSLAAIFLEPVRVRILRRWIDSYTLVLVDDSSSMDLTDRYRDPDAAKHVAGALGVDEVKPIRRADLTTRLLERDDRALLRSLAERNRVKVYTFSDEPELRGTIRQSRERRAQTDESGDAAESVAGANDVALTLGATGGATNVARAVRRAVESVGSAPIAGVVVISDGGFNQGGSVDHVARFAAERRIPLHVVGVGDPSPPRNVRVTEILAPENVFKQDPFTVSGRIVTQGVEGESFEVRLLERGAASRDAGKIVQTKRVTIRPGGTADSLSFECRQAKPGRYVYAIEVPVADYESVLDDNSKQTTVTVIDASTRVLIVAGEPSWDYRFVSRLLQRDDTFDVSCWLQSASLSAVRDGNTIIDHLPRLAEELLAYDVVLLMDVDPDELDTAWCELVDKLVTEHGGGLLLAAGRAHTPSFFRDQTFAPLVDLLPVSPDPEADLILNRVGHYQLAASPIEIPDAAFGNPVLRFGHDAASSRLAWQGAAEVYWHYPVLREKPVATVLMRNGNPRMRNAYGGHVLAALQFVGRGRSAFLGFDGTWRWRRFGVERFDRFWVQMVRYLAEGKLLGGSRRGTIVTDSDQFSLGDAVTVSARLYDARFEPLRRDEVTARFQSSQGRGEFTLRARADRPGWFEGRFVPDHTGSYRLSLVVPDPAAREPIEITREIRVSRPNIEVLRPQMDMVALRALAEGSAGGRYYHVDELSNVPEMIQDLHEETPIRSRPKSLWDNAWVMGLLMTLLSVEWALRKWNRLL